MKSWCLAACAALSLTAGLPSRAGAASAEPARPILLTAHPVAKTTTAKAQPQGDEVLHDQLPNIAVYAIPVGDYAAPEAALDVAHGADDFDVTDPEGWTVTAFDFILHGDENMTAPANIRIYPAGLHDLPSATPICSALGATATWDAEDPTSTARVNLPTPCVLPPGKYWLSPAGSERTYYWLGYDDAGTRGLPALWRSPGGSYGEACRDWADVFKCWHTANMDVKFNFRVLGHVGHEAGGIDLAVTLAPFDANAPDACGSAGSLAVTVGDPVSVCYTITNRAGTDLHFHTLSDNLGGDLFVQREQSLGLDQSMSFQRVITAGLATDIVATWTARDFAASYSVDDTVAADFIDLSASPSATELPPTQWPMADDGAVALTAPFPFALFGRAVNTFCIGNNGYLIVGSPSETEIWAFCYPGDLWANGALPNTQFEWPVILPAWMDLYLDGTTYYETIGEPGARRFVVQWHQRNRWATVPAPGTVTFQAILDEANGAITFQYDQMAFEDAESPSGDYGQQATVGLQENRASALQYAFGQPLLTNGKAIRWTPTGMQPYTGVASAQLDVGAPTVVATPTALQASIEVGASTIATMQLANTGDRDLLWNVERAWPTLHFPPGDARPIATTVPAANRARRSFDLPASTEANAFKAEQKRLARLRDPARPIGSPLPVPAYGIHVEGLDENEEPVRHLVSLDATAPDAYDEIAISPGGPFGPPPFNYGLNASGAAFVDNDFNRLYVIGSAGTFGYFDLADDGAFHTIQLRIEINPGDDTIWCTFSLQPCWTGLSWDAATATLYTVGVVYRYDFEDPDYVPLSSQLFSIDLVTGTPTPIGAPMQGLEISDTAIDAQGLMYGIDPTADVLLAIDKTNGAYRPIGPINFNALGSGYIDQSISFDPSTGVLWYAADRYVSPFEVHGEMYTLDTLTGAATLHAGMYRDAPLNVFEVAVRSGPCSRPTDIGWLSYVGATQGITAPNGTAEVTVKFDAQGLAPGIYEADACVFSNDPIRRNHPLSVPVQLTVTGDAGERIFSDSFENSAP